MAGDVLISGQKARKSGQPVAEDSRLELLARPAHVSRGGLKLAAALERFDIHPEGRICIDIRCTTFINENMRRSTSDEIDVDHSACKK